MCSLRATLRAVTLANRFVECDLVFFINIIQYKYYSEKQFQKYFKIKFTPIDDKISVKGY